MAAQVHNTVFISYRRKVSRYLARSLHKDLTDLGFDVFRDVDDIPPGEFKPVILNQIEARAHFIVLIAEDTLDRCSERGDWLRREIEHAMKLKRNIIPVLVDGFTFEKAEKYLNRELKKLKNYQAQTLYEEHYDSAITQLKKKMDYPVSVKLKRTTSEETPEVEEILTESVGEPKPTSKELSAEFLFLRGHSKHESGDLDGAIADYTEAIRRNPLYFEAYANRGNVLSDKGDFAAAIADYNRVLELNHNDPIAYSNRGIVRYEQGDFAGAMIDFDNAVRVGHSFGIVYYNRAKGRTEQDDLVGALSDLNKAIRLSPEFAHAYVLRGIVRRNQGNLSGAIADFDKAIRKDPKTAMAYFHRGVAWQKRGSLHKAMADFNAGIELDPQNADYYDARAEAYFASKEYEKALSDFQKTDELKPGYKFALSGLAITHHALGNVDEAKRFWMQLLDKDARYNDADWVKQELNWADPLVDEARKLIAAM